MKISIVVPVYNTRSYLEDCLQSIIGQTYENIEILVIDDGSTDGSGAVCEELASKDSRIKYIWQSHSGVVSARRKGVECATGEYMMFIDSDDVMEREMAKILVTEIKNSGMITSGVYYELNQEVATEYYDKYPEGEYQGNALEMLLGTMLYDEKTDDLQRLTPWICNKLYRTDMVREVYRDLDMTMTFAEDSVFLYKYILQCDSIKICHKSLYHYLYRETSAVHKINTHMLMDINKAYLSLFPDFTRHPLKKLLIPQLEHWVCVAAVMAVNGRMGFGQEMNIPEFILDTDGLKGKRIVIYGAGRMGKDYYRQLMKMGYEVVLWVDGNYKQIKGVHSPDEIPKTKYDRILIAVSRWEYADSIISVLLNMGIDKEQILWKKPVRIV